MDMMMRAAVPAQAFYSMKPTLEAEERRAQRLQITFWLAAVLVVLALHGGIAWYLLHAPRAEPLTQADMGAVMIELAPTIEQAASQVDAAVSKPEEAASAAAEPPKEERPREEAEETKPIATAEEAPVAAVAPLPPPPKQKLKPVEKKKAPEKPKPEKTAQKPRPTQAPSKAAAVRTASAPRSDQRAAATRAASAGAASSASTADWKGQVAAALNRNKRYPSGVTATGSPILRVAIAVSGQVSSASVVASSGSPELDRAAIETIHRASPLPPPPSGATMLTFRMNFQSR
ncbi:TonB family protein [Methylobacterium sp. 1030]|uniref:TonB family protein n=1 Tax=Methylobacterium sp. 1030 TaxID=3156404 RepID=UPI0033927EA9